MAVNKLIKEQVQVCWKWRVSWDNFCCSWCYTPGNTAQKATYTVHWTNFHLGCFMFLLIRSNAIRIIMWTMPQSLRNTITHMHTKNLGRTLVSRVQGLRGSQQVCTLVVCQDTTVGTGTENSGYGRFDGCHTLQHVICDSSLSQHCRIMGVAVFTVAQPPLPLKSIRHDSVKFHQHYV